MRTVSLIIKAILDNMNSLPAYFASTLSSSTCNGVGGELMNGDSGIDIGPQFNYQ
jgi:hypothetical protein